MKLGGKLFGETFSSFRRKVESRWSALYGRMLELMKCTALYNMQCNIETMQYTYSAVYRQWRAIYGQCTINAVQYTCSAIYMTTWIARIECNNILIAKCYAESNIVRQDAFQLKRHIYSRLPSNSLQFTTVSSSYTPITHTSRLKLTRAQRSALVASCV